MIYEKIYDFCKVKNLGSVFKNTDSPTPRVEFLLNLLEEEGITYELDKFTNDEVTGYNIILRGDSDKMLVAHHDIVNPHIDNANDNSASVINAIALKKMSPHIHVVLLDGEEFGGYGSQRVSEQILEGEFGEISYVLNLELTGRGGKRFFIGNYPGPLYDQIKSQFNPPTFNTPFNDSVIFRRNGIDSCVINPLPTTLNEGLEWDSTTKLDVSILYYCHSEKDTVELISTKEMQEFTEEIVHKILNT
jgi:hypothetical protein